MRFGVVSDVQVMFLTVLSKTLEISLDHVCRDQHCRSVQVIDVHRDWMSLRVTCEAKRHRLRALATCCDSYNSS